MPYQKSILNVINSKTSKKQRKHGVALVGPSVMQVPIYEKGIQMQAT